jgi:hypothetical protein
VRSEMVGQNVCQGLVWGRLTCFGITTLFGKRQETYICSILDFLDNTQLKVTFALHESDMLIGRLHLCLKSGVRSGNNKRTTKEESRFRRYVDL